MKALLNPPRGTRDYMPDEMNKIIYVTEKIRSIFELYGYVPIETPAFENCAVLRAKCGDEVDREIYKFKDKSGRDLGLRFDLTVPLARIVARNPSLPKPFRRYCISKAWRYERPEAKRRFREFMQADVDIVGSGSVECDAEVLAVATDCLKALGFQEFYIKLNNRKILEGLAEKATIPSSKYSEVFRVLDKLEKKSLKAVKAELIETLGTEYDETINEFLNFITNKGVTINLDNEVIKANLENTIGEEGIKELRQMLSVAESYGMSEKIFVDFSLARGLDYYTGSVFEIIIEHDEDLGSVAGGGRYDGLIELFGGESTPATGISMGIDRIVRVMEKRNMFDLPKTKTKVFIAHVKGEMKIEAPMIAQMLRKKGIPTEVEVMGRTLTRQLVYADKKGIGYVVIMGKSDFSKGCVKLRNMTDRTQKLVKKSSLIQHLLS